MHQKKLPQFFLITLFLVTLTQVSQAGSVPLLDLYPGLQQNPNPELHVHHVSLGNFPTPVQKLETLSSNIYIKRDDFSATPFGGNKIRKLEFLFGNALFGGAKGVLTQGFAGSNHTTATATIAQQLGLECYAMHLPQPITSSLRRNLLLSHHYDAKLYLCRNEGERDKMIHELNLEFHDKTGGYLYFIPSGGSNEIGALGFINAIFELKEQIAQGLVPEPDFIYVACGSVGTTCGLMMGTKLAGLKTKIVSIAVEHDDYPGQHLQKLTTMYRMTSMYLNKRDPNFPLLELNPEEVMINVDFVGERYGQTTQEAADAINLLQQTENIKLDGTYSGKAFAGMLYDIQTKKLDDKVVLFWNTFCSGDFSAIIDTVDYKQLPRGYHVYFMKDLQKLDQGT